MDVLTQIRKPIEREMADFESAFWYYITASECSFDNGFTTCAEP